MLLLLDIKSQNSTMSHIDLDVEGCRIWRANDGWIDYAFWACGFDLDARAADADDLAVTCDVGRVSFFAGEVKGIKEDNGVGTEASMTPDP
jgi:hypothetical protein